jgi:hypothetical protein
MTGSISGFSVAASSSVGGNTTSAASISGISTSSSTASGFFDHHERGGRGHHRERYDDYRRRDYGDRYYEERGRPRRPRSPPRHHNNYYSDDEYHDQFDDRRPPPPGDGGPPRSTGRGQAANDLLSSAGADATPRILPHSVGAATQPKPRLTLATVLTSAPPPADVTERREHFEYGIKDVKAEMKTRMAELDPAAIVLYNGSCIMGVASRRG